LDLRLNLPNLEKKWQLKFITYDQDQEERALIKIVSKQHLFKQIMPEVSGSSKLGKVNLQFEPRLQFQGGVQVSYFRN